MSYFKKYLKYKNKYFNLCKYQNKYRYLKEKISSSEQQKKIKITYANNDRYSGDAYISEKKVIKHGNGIYTFNNKDVYMGEFKNNMFNGHGKYVYDNGDEYTGSFIDNEFDGVGLLKDADGGYYEGNFKNGAYHGTGILVDKRGVEYYKGEFRNDSYNGIGKLTNIEDDKIISIYEGNFDDGFYEGEGELKKPNSDYYRGIFKEGEFFEGIGKITYPNGGTYEGNFKNGKRNGEGKYMYKDGNFYNGNFINDNININIINNQQYFAYKDCYTIVIYVNSHGCDIKDDYITDRISQYNNVFPIYLGEVDYKCIASGGFDNIDMYYASYVFNQLYQNLDESMEYYQRNIRGNYKALPPNYDHIFSFGLNEDNSLNNIYDGIFIIKNDIGLPENINLFDWEPQKIFNNEPKLRELGEYINRYMYNDGETLYNLRLSQLIKGFHEWMEQQSIDVAKKVKLVIIDSSCRVTC